MNFGSIFPNNLSSNNAIIGRIVTQFKKAKFPEKIIFQVKKSYSRLKLKRAYVAVRSSATVEDTVEASFAGQLESFLNLENLDICLDFTSPNVGRRKNW
ncbi:MAG: hypothetical protein IIC76_13915 [Bacteroidetes bacterium]|nr:hypothetical protein [Bacteroidota bacterium]